MASFSSDRRFVSPLAKGVIVGLCTLCWPYVVSAQTCASANEYMSMGTFPKDGSGLKAGNQFGFSFSGQYTNFSAIKLYIPPGTTEFGVRGFLSQQVPYAVAARLGQPPTRRTAVDGSVGSGEYGAINANSTKNTLGARLLGGEEMIFVHDGGGNTTYGGANLFRWPLLKGKWLYVRVLTGFDIFGLQGEGYVDKALFSSLIATTSYDAGGQTPLEDCALPVKPTGIQLASTSVQAGGTGEVTPIPVDALVIGECSADPASPISPYIQFNNYKFTVLAGAPTGTVTIGCGNATDASSGSAMLSWPSVVQPKFTTTLTIGTPAPLEGLSLSANYINVTNPASITINPVPSNASIGSCSLSGAGAAVATVSGSTISFNSGSAVTSPMPTTVTCSGKTASFTIQPPPSLVLSPSTLVQGSGASVTATKSDGTFAQSCQLTGGAGATINPYDYLNVTAGTITFKPTAPALPQSPSSQQVSVTCDGSSAANLSISPAPVGVLYPVKDGSDSKRLLLRWREVDSSGNINDLVLADSKYPSYPATGSANTFECKELGGKSYFTITNTTATAVLKTPVALSDKTTISCSVSDTGGTQISGSVKNTPPIKVNTDGTWEIAQPTANDPIMDDPTSTTAKFQLYVPSSTSGGVPVVVMGYVPRIPSFLWDEDTRTEVMFKGPQSFVVWTGTQTESDLVYTTVSSTHPTRILDVDLGFSKSQLATLKAKVMVFYKDGVTWKTLTPSGSTTPAEWDSTK